MKLTKEQRNVIKYNQNLTDKELLNWAMNQLFRAAREIDLLRIGKSKRYVGLGCDATAICILKRLIKTKSGYRMVKNTNPKLLRGYINRHETQKSMPSSQTVSFQREGR